eukprot:NODE_27_length_33950_cov_0.349739.p16 type:complete len:140 gc:universal NODE_27_length_33950_cov_0.349739:10726-11145(+)
MYPTRDMQFSCTCSCLFLNIGVSLGNRSLIGGVIVSIPMATTTLFSPAIMLARVSGYSSPRYSYKTTPRLFSCFNSLQSFNTIVILDINSAVNCLTLGVFEFSLNNMVLIICSIYGLAFKRKCSRKVLKAFKVTGSSID